MLQAEPNSACLILEGSQTSGVRAPASQSTHHRWCECYRAIVVEALHRRFVFGSGTIIEVFKQNHSKFPLELL